MHKASVADLSVLYTLSNMGLSDNMLLLLQNMYKKAVAQVRVNTELSDIFSCTSGVKQGCNLSPLLFILFISDLEEHLKGRGVKGIGMFQRTIHLLQFADDLVLLAESEVDLKVSLEALNDYCKESDLRINATKTKIMIFNRRSRKQAFTFTLDDTEIQRVEEYKYLGLVIKENGNINTEILASQANKALFSLKSTIASLKYPSPKILSHLFDSLVCPILDYGCEIWGFSNVEVLERIHRNFCKFALGLPTSATNLACFGELGRPPLMIRWKLKILKYWIRIVTDWNMPPLVLDAYHMAVENNLTWATQSKSLLDRLGFSEAWIEPELMNLTTFMCEVKERLTDQYTQSWRQMLRESTGKLRTYRTFKHDFRMEAYLNLPVYLRIPVTKFRVSAHPLRIETGRYALPQPIPPGERYCWFCQNTVEDEVHFLLECPAYEDNRKHLQRSNTNLNRNFVHWPNGFKFNFIMQNKDPSLQLALAKFIKKSLEKRQDLLQIL